MCEDPRWKLAPVICSVCVVDCPNRNNRPVRGCEFGKPSNEAMRWAFEFTNHLKHVGLPKLDATPKYCPTCGQPVNKRG